MDAHLPDEMLAAVKTRGPRRRGPGFRVRSGEREHDVLALRPTGFDIAAPEDADGDPHLRGFVDLMHGPNRLARCLIIRAEQADGVVSYEFKLRNDDLGAAPVDYPRNPDGPIALIEG